jgi:HPt (histidine-containing phosphotransfer) domain-containing protein
MMVELTDAARHCLDEYLAEVRSSLRHCPSVDLAEIERDVVDHIQHALSGSAEAIDAPELQGVLKKLGSPAQWVPQEELSQLQRCVAALRSGPEDLRLGYLALALVAGTLFASACLNPVLGAGRTLPFLLLGIAASFIFARASLSAAGGVGPAERWLIYPSLIAVYVPMTALLLLWPVAAAIVTEVFLREAGRPEDVGYWTHIYPTGAIATFSLVTIGTLWLSLLSFIAWRWPAVLRDGYAPFAAGFRRRSRLLGFSVVCLLIFFGCAAVGGRQYSRDRRIMSQSVVTPAPNSYLGSRPLP